MVRWLYFCGAFGPQAAPSGQKPTESVETGDQIIGTAKRRGVAVPPETISPRRRRKNEPRSPDGSFMRWHQR